MSDSLRRASILFKDRACGILEETAGLGSRFTYDKAWPDPIACALPVTRREHEWTDGLHPFFQHLGAEGWLRQEQALSGHLSQEDDLGLLLAYGADCIGAVSIEPIGGPVPVPQVVDAVPPGRTVSGVQKKLLVIADGSQFKAAGATGPAPFIAKFNPEHISDLVRNEYRALRWTASVLGEREVTAFRLGEVAGQEGGALIVTRFDRTEEGGKLRLEDFAQILGRPRGRDFSGKYQGSYEELAAALGRHSVRPQLDVARFFRRLIAFILVGNCDAHLKNFSLLETADGMRLSPAYDVVNSAVYPRFDQRLALEIGGRKISHDEVDRPLLERFGAQIGLRPAAIALAFRDLNVGTRRAAKSIAPHPSDAPDSFPARFAETVSNACHRILDR